MHFSELARRISKDKSIRAYIFTGKEEFLKQEGVKILEDALDIPPENISGFSFSKSEDTSQELPKLLDELYTSAFNGKLKLVIVSDANGVLAKEMDWAKEYIKSSSENILVMFTDKKILLPENESIIVDCSMDEDSIIGYVNSLLSKKKVKTTPDAVTELCQRCAFNLSVITTSIDKILSAYKQKKELTLEDVKVNVVDETQYDAFDLVNAITRNDVGLAVKILHRLLGERVSLQAIIGAISWQYRTAYEVKTLLEKRIGFYKIAGELKIGAYRVEELAKTICKLPMAELRKKLAILLEIDLMSKTTGEQDEILGDVLIFKLMNRDDRVLQVV